MITMIMLLLIMLCLKLCVLIIILPHSGNHPNRECLGRNASTDLGTVSFHNFQSVFGNVVIQRGNLPKTPRLPSSGRGAERTSTVSFHNFKSQNFKLSVSHPKNKYVVYLSVLSHISNCQGLGRKNKHEILKIDRMRNPGARTGYAHVADSIPLAHKKVPALSSGRV